MNPDQSLIDELLDRWDEERSAGRQPDLQRLCQDHPEALPVLREQIRAFEQMDQLLKRNQPATLNTSAENGSPASAGSQVSSVSVGSIVSTAARYRVIKSHARGGLGEVLVAQDEQLARRVALKQMHAPLSADPVRRRRFLREAEITGRLDHPGIVSILGVGQDENGNPCYAMEFVSGETLAEKARELHRQFAESGGSLRKSFESTVIRPLVTRFISVCNTIAYAHSHGVIHRDIKPGNVMLGDYSATYVVDWGLAKSIGQVVPVGDSQTSPPTFPPVSCDAETTNAVDSVTADDDQSIADRSLTGIGTVMGTPAYMSPEQASGDMSNIGPASDIYSLGSTLYFVLTGRASVGGDSDARWIEQLKSGRFPRPTAIQRLVPRALEAICLKAMATQPDHRYATALELAADLEHWMADEPVAALQESVSEKLARFMRQHRAWTQSIAVAVVAIAIIASVFAVLLNTQKNIAESAESKSTLLARQKSQLADDQARLAAREATARKVAEEQNQLSLATLKSVVFSISRKLKLVAGAGEVRQALLKTSIDGLNRVARTLDTRTEIDRNLMIAHNDIGRTYLLAGNVEGTDSTAEALKHYTRANEIAQKLVAENQDDSDLQRQLSISYESIGDVLQQLGDLKLAEAAYLHSLLISEQQVAMSPNDHDLKRDVAFGFEKLGDVRLAREQVGLAKTAYTRCHQLYTENAQAKPDNSMLQRDLLVAQSKLGNILLQEGDLPGAAKAYRECIVTCLALEKIPDSGSQPRDRSVMLNKLGGVLQKQSLLAEAAETFNEGLTIATQIVEADPTDAGAQRDLSISLNNLGDIRVLEVQLDPARTHFLRGLEIRRALAAKDASSQVAQVDVAQSLLRLGELEQQAAQPEKAVGYFTEAMAILQPLKEADKLQSAADQLLLETVQKHLAKVPPKKKSDM